VYRAGLIHHAYSECEAGILPIFDPLPGLNVGKSAFNSHNHLCNEPYTPAAMAAEYYENHYENFPVASFLLPAELREPIAAIYWFARSADDMADEGDLPAHERELQLRAYLTELDRLESGQTSTHPVFARLAPHIAHYRLPISLFRDLIDAFLQDVHQDRYATRAELLDYCRRSANPVGRLLLHLFNEATPDNLTQSDAVCTALQLINHWQDVGIDAGKGPRGRIYLPQDAMQQFSLDDRHIQRRITSTDFRKLLSSEVASARALMESGAPLGWRLPGRMGMEIRAIVAGGLRILDKIEAVNYDVFNRRPALTARDWLGITWRTLVRPLD
jgi:squalene synthase HpnC